MAMFKEKFTTRTIDDSIVTVAVFEYKNKKKAVIKLANMRNGCSATTTPIEAFRLFNAAKNMDRLEAANAIWNLDNA